VAENDDDVDKLLRWYLEDEMSDERVTKDDCEVRHEKLDLAVEKAIEDAKKSVSSHLKIWFLGGLAGIILAVGGTIVCGTVEVGQYKERVDGTGKQLEEHQRSQTLQFEELKQEIRELRNLLLRRDP
jgi:hypothetical protein